MLSLLLGTILISFSAQADEDAPEAATNSENAVTVTNAIPLADLMTSNNIVTNTVGTVLVKISATLWAGQYEVTQREYEEVMGGNPSSFSGTNHPVDSVTWSDAMAFCKKLTTMETETNQLPDGFKYSLPTETQWEMLADGASLKDAVMKYNSATNNSTAPVGSLGANSLGLYDTRGNVMEWCLDSHDPSYHVLRGGAWDTAVEPSTRIEFRNYVQNPDERKNDYGFRIVLESGQ